MYWYISPKLHQYFNHYPVLYIRLLCLSVTTITQNSKFLVFTDKVIAYTMYDIKPNVFGDSSAHPSVNVSVLKLFIFCGVTRDNTVLLKHLIYLKYTTVLCPGYIKT